MKYTFEHWENDNINERSADGEHSLNIDNGLTALKHKGKLPQQEFDRIREAQEETFRKARAINFETNKKHISERMEQAEDRDGYLAAKLEQTKDSICSTPRRKHILTELKAGNRNTQIIKGHHYQRVMKANEADPAIFMLSNERGKYVVEEGETIFKEWIENNGFIIVASLWDQQKHVERLIEGKSLTNPMSPEIGEKQVEELFSLLGECSKIDTDRENFFDVFTGSNFREPITWKGNNAELRDTLEIAHNKKKNLEYKKMAKACFIDNNGNEMTLNKRSETCAEGNSIFYPQLERIIRQE